MKQIFLLTATILFAALTLNAQGPSQQSAVERLPEISNFKVKPAFVADFNFTVFDAGVNTKYTEYGSSFFMDKYIIISARKIGAIGGAKDENTNEPYTELFCTDVDKYGNLSRPLLFSRIINTLASEGSVTFSPDEKVI